MRHNLLRTGLAVVLASLTVQSAPAQTYTDGPRPAEPARANSVQPATSSPETLPRPAPIGKDSKIKPAVGEKDSGVHQLTIYAGPNRTVHYYANSGSPSEQAALRKLEQAENELGYQDSLLALRQQYVNTESQMEARRRELQRKLYGVSMTDRVTNSASYPGIGIGFPSPYGTPFDVGVANGGFWGGAGSMSGFGGAGGGGPWAGYGLSQINLTQESVTSQSLANGIGDEGKFKTAMVTEMARQATPESTSTALRNYESALANAVGVRANRGDIAAASFEKMAPRKVTVTTKGNEKIQGILVSQDNDWVVVRTTDSEERIRMADVARIKLEIPTK